MLPPTTQSGAVVLKELSLLSKELKYYADGFKEARKLKAFTNEMKSFKRHQEAITRQVTKQYAKLEFATKQVDKTAKVAQKTADTVKKTADKANKLAASLKKTTDKISGTLKNILSKVDKTGKLALQAKQAIDKLNNLLNKTVFKKVLPSKAGILLNSLAMLATAGVIVLSAKNAEYIQGIDLEKERVVQIELDNQIRLISKNFNATKRLENANKQLEKEVRANSEAINVINAFSGETRRYAMRVEASFQLALQQLSIKSNSDIQLLRNNLAAIVRQVTINQQTLFNGFQSLKQQVQNRSDQLLLTRVQAVENRVAVVNQSVRQAEVKTNQTETRVQRVEARVTTLESKQPSAPFQSQLLENLRSRVTDLSTRLVNLNKEVVNIENTLPTKVEQIATPLAVRIVNGKLERISTDIKDVNIKVDKKIDKDQLVTTIKFDGGNIVRVLEPYIKPVINQQTAGLTNAIPALSGGIAAIANDLNKLKFDINNLKVREPKVTNPPPVDLSPILRRLDQTDIKIGLIPALVLAPLGKNLDQIRQNIPTVQQFTNAAATANCRTLQPGGCTRRALDDLGGSLLNNQNQNANNLLNAINTGQNAAQLAALNDIQSRLGPQLPGGISGFLEKFFKKFNDLAKWMQLDRVLNVLIWWQTIHNAGMLSLNIGQTLGSGLNNVLSFMGIKDFEGNPIDIGAMIGKAYTEALKSALGETTYNNLNKSWNAANRIYQSVTNAVNLIQNIQQSILNALEVVGAGVSKIANALRWSGAVFERSYEWMNPQPNFDNRFFNFLNKFQETASTIEMITQTPLDIKSSIESLNEEKKQFKEALKDGENSLKGLGIIESETEKNKADTSKQVSLGKDLDSLDKVEANA